MGRGRERHREGVCVYLEKKTACVYVCVPKEIEREG